MNADKLASFRVDSDLWQKFQGYAKENNTNASALLVAYIKSVVNTGNVNTSNPIINTSAEVNAPTLSIQDIDKRIDDKIKQSIQNINTMSLQDIDNRIMESLADGGIGDAIATSYKAVMGNFNGLLEELQDIKSKLQELQIPPAAAAAVPDDQLPIPCSQLPITDDQLPITDDQLPITDDQLPISDRNTQIIELLKIENIIEGELYSAESLEDDGIFDLISTNQKYLEELIGEKLTLKKDTADVNKLLKIMGYATERTTKDKKKYNRIKVPKLPE